MAKKGAVPASVAKKKSTATKAAGGGSGTGGAAAKPRVGVAEFVDFIGDWGTDEWVVMAVEAPREQVARAYARLARAKDVHESVQVRPAKKNDLGVISYLVPVVSTSGSAWTSILWITGLPIGLQDIETGDRIAGKLSAQFKTRALCFAGEDTSGAMAVTLFEDGKLTARKDWDLQTDPSDDYFGKLGFYLPGCAARSADKAPCVIATPEAAARIDGADLIDLGDE